MNNTIPPRKSRFKTCFAAIGSILWCVVFLSSPPFSMRANAQETAQTQTIVICTNSANSIHRIATDFIREAYRRIGHDVEFVELPNRRSLIQANDGACDAETVRIGGLDTTYKNLIPVPIPVTELHGVAFMRHHDNTHPPEINTWQDMQGLDIYVIHGEVYAERGTANLGAGSVGTYKQLFTMLEQGRIDVGIGIKHVGLIELAQNFPNSSIHTHGAPLLSAPMYHYIHRKNRRLLKDLTRVLNGMAESGELEIINAKALSRLMAQPPN